MGSMNKYRVAVLAGGRSSEREVSLRSGKNVAETLKKSGFDVKMYDPTVDLGKIIAERDQIEVVFPVLHGPFGEDGTIQGFLELIGLPYVGSGVLASALAMDKEMAREVFARAGLLIPKGITIKNVKTPQDDWKEVGLPCVVKPVSSGSSFGVTIVHNEQDLDKAVKKAGDFDGRILIEEYIKGTELTVGVLGNDELEALPVIEIRPPGEFFSEDVKYTGQTQEIVPAPISPQAATKAQSNALTAHKALGCRGMSRTDMIMKDSGIYVIETNTIPGMTGESLLPKAGIAAGIEFPQLLEKLLDLAMEGKDAARQG